MGLLISTSRSGNTISYAYDRFGRDSVETRSVSGLGTRTFQYTYGSNGLLSNVQYPGTVDVGYQYDSYGNRSKVTAGGTTVWQITNINAQNSAITTTIQLGSSLKTTQIADLAGRVTGKSLQYIYGVPIRSMMFTYNAATGNMTGRTGMFSSSESFSYDNLDRLTGIQYGNGSSLDISYAPNGNITMQTDIGRYYFEGSKPHAVTAVDNTRHRIPTSQLQTQYNAFGKVSQIRDYGENNYKMLFDYGPDDERWRTRFYRNTSTLQRTTYYMGDYGAASPAGYITSTEMSCTRSRPAAPTACSISSPTTSAASSPSSTRAAARSLRPPTTHGATRPSHATTSASTVAIPAMRCCQNLVSST